MPGADAEPKHVSTSYVERSNLTMRMHNLRFTRLTNAFSKKVENHAYSVALFTTYNNFVKVRSKLRMSRRWRPACRIDFGRLQMLSHWLKLPRRKRPSGGHTGREPPREVIE